MILLWEDYKSSSRMAVVRYEQRGGRDLTGDILYIQPGHISFLSDGYGTSIPNDRSPFYALRSGDIVSIDERGFVEKIFSVEENDAVIFITGHCNSNCVMCPSSDRERQTKDGMTDSEIQQFIALLPEDTAHIAVTGGEPTLRPETFFKTMGLIADKFPRIETQLLTNGRAFASKKMVARLVEHCPPYLRAAIPIHGSYSSLHNSITQAPGSFEQTVAGLYHLFAEDIFVEIRVVVSKLNCNNLQSIAKFIAENFPDTGIVNFIGLETRGSCAKNFDDVYIDHKLSVSKIMPAVQILAQAGIDVALYNYPLCAVNQKYWSLCKQSISPEKIRFPADCGECAAKPYCGGFFSTTLSLAKPSVKPIRF